MIVGKRIRLTGWGCQYGLDPQSTWRMLNEGRLPPDLQVERAGHIHHKAAAIAKPTGRVVVETLNVAGMVRNRKLSRAIADAGMSGFLTKLEYKCLWYGAELAKADRWYPSSKLCSHCGWKNGGLTLSDRQRCCGDCGALNDRDPNSAGNLANWPGLSFPVPDVETV